MRWPGSEATRLHRLMSVEVRWPGTKLGTRGPMKQLVCTHYTNSGGRRIFAFITEVNNWSSALACGKQAGERNVQEHMWQHRNCTSRVSGL